MALNTELQVLRWILAQGQSQVDAANTAPQNVDRIWADEDYNPTVGVADIAAPDELRWPFITRVAPFRTRSFFVRPFPTAWYEGERTLILIAIPGESKTYTLDEIIPVSKTRWRITLTEIIPAAGREYAYPIGG